MRSRYHADAIAGNRGHREITGHSGPPFLGWAFAALVLAVFTSVAIAAIADGAPAVWIIYWCTLASLTAATPWAPAAGAGAFAALVYGTPRYEEIYVRLAELPLLDLVAGFALAGCAVWMIRGNRRPRFHPALLWLVILFLAWVAASAAVAFLQGRPLQPTVRHDPASFLHALAFFLVASQGLGKRPQAILFAGIFCAALLARAIIQGPDGLFLEGDIAPLAVMALPLALLGVVAPQPLALRGAFLLIGLSLVAVAGLALNRAAGAAFAVMILLLWWQTPRKGWLLAASLPGIAAAAAWFVSSGYWDRFRAIWTDEGLRSGLDRATITERLELWRGALEIVRDHPLFGVGPSNYKDVIAGYLSPALDGMAAHNSWLHVASETGIPGLALYSALFLAGLVAAQRAKSRRGAWGWPDAGARLVQASLVAYLVAAMFITRHDMVLAYLLLGSVSGLWVSAREESLRRRVFDDRPVPGREARIGRVPPASPAD